MIDCTILHKIWCAGQVAVIAATDTRSIKKFKLPTGRHFAELARSLLWARLASIISVDSLLSAERDSLVASAQEVDR